MKKLLSITLAICMLCALSLPALAEETDKGPLLIAPAPNAAETATETPAAEETEKELPGRVEISFRVGDSVLKINGTDVEVATPYVVGEGVTLVPLRVITEAFGATVGWDGDTQTVTLDYPGVNIVLQIGNPIADVNGKAQTLLAAPELPGSSTMVPLRFISETFGATVSYDEATEAILVVKEAEDTSGTVQGAITTARIGDSYYGWSMENPTNMTMTDRSFDGLSTTFSGSEGNFLNIYIDVADEDFNLAREFEATQKGLTDFSLVQADKFPEKNGYHIQVRDKEKCLDLYAFCGENYYFELTGIFSNEDTALRDECLRILSTFTLSYTAEDTHDLSNVKDGYRTYEDEDLGISLPIPSGFFAYESDSQNSVSFYALAADDYVSEISLQFYSVSNAGDAEKLAKYDNASNKARYNESLTTISDVQSVTYGDLAAFEYTITVRGSSTQDADIRDIFFTVGDYVYNLTIFHKPDEKDTAFDFNAYVSAIANGLKITKLDSSKTGVFMLNRPNDTDTYVSKTDDWTMTLPLSFDEVQVNESAALYSNEHNGVIFYCLRVDLPNANFTKAQSELKATETSVLKEYGKSAKLITGASPKNINGKQYAYDVILLEADGEKTYTVQYALPANKNELIVFIAYLPELLYSTSNVRQIEHIISTFTLTK